MKFVQLSSVNPLQTNGRINTQYTVPPDVEGRPVREFQDIRGTFPSEKVLLGPLSQRRIYGDEKGDFPQRTTIRPKGSMYDIDMGGWRNGCVGDGQSKTYGFLGYPYHNYVINERVTTKKPISISFPQYDGTLSYVNHGKPTENF
jgi:hypothetical protein